MDFLGGQAGGGHSNFSTCPCHYGMGNKTSGMGTAYSVFQANFHGGTASLVTQDVSDIRQNKSLTTHQTLCCTCAAILFYKAVGA